MASASSVSQLLLAAISVIPRLYDPEGIAACLASLSLDEPAPASCSRLVADFAYDTDLIDEVSLEKTAENVLGKKPQLEAIDSALEAVLRDRKGVLLEELQNAGETADPKITSGQESLLMSFVHKTRMNWSLWKNLLEDSDAPLDERILDNFRNIFRLKFRVNLGLHVGSVCRQISPQQFRYLYATLHRAHIKRVCEKFLDFPVLETAVQIFLEPADLGKYDALATDAEKSLHVHKYVFSRFYEEHDFQQLLELQSLVRRVPIELHPKAKVECLGRDVLAGCVSVVAAVSAISAIPSEFRPEDDVLEWKLGQLEIFRLRLRRLLVSPDKEPFLARLSQLYASRPQASLSGIELTVLSLITHMKGGVGLEDEIYEVSEILPIFHLFQFSPWKFWSLVLREFQSREEVSNLEFATRISFHAKDALMAEIRVAMVPLFVSVCRDFARTKLPFDLARACEAGTLYKVKNALESYPGLLDQLDLYILSNNRSRFLITVRNLFSSLVRQVPSSSDVFVRNPPAPAANRGRWNLHG